MLLLGLYHFCLYLSPSLHEMIPWYLIFLKRSLVFPILLFSSISLQWSLRKAFLSLLAILWNSAFKWVFSFHSNPKERQYQECSNYRAIALISHASKVMFKIPQARLQQCVNHELLDVQTDFRKGRGTRDQIAIIHWIIQKARVPEKHLFLLYWLCQSLCVDHHKL